MKQLKLEVGKTYRNRKGEEVKIARKDDNSWTPYKGINGEWYTEDGSYWFKKHPEDLIAEVPETCHAFITPDEAKKVTATRYTFAIPDGMTKLTVEQVGNRIIVEMVPKEGPKPGDVMVNHSGSVYIFKDVYGSYHKDYAWLGKDGRLVIGGHCYPGRPATPEEAQPLWDALKKAGKRWNPEAMQVEDVEPKPGDVMITPMGGVYIFKEAVDSNNHNYYVWLGKNSSLAIGMMCSPGRPATPEEAQPLWDALKKAGKRWNAEAMEVEEITEIDRIREWVERHFLEGHYTQDNISEVIETYLNYREGEK